MAKKRPAIKCVGYRKDGQPCKAWAKHGADKCAACLKRGGAPKANTHAVDPAKPYSTYFSKEDLLVMANQPEGPDLLDFLQQMCFARLMRIQKRVKVREVKGPDVQRAYDQLVGRIAQLTGQKEDLADRRKMSSLSEIIDRLQPLAERMDHDRRP